jgi:hypothetical protein
MVSAAVLGSFFPAVGFVACRMRFRGSLADAVRLGPPGLRAAVLCRGCFLAVSLRCVVLRSGTAGALQQYMLQQCTSGASGAATAGSNPSLPPLSPRGHSGVHSGRDRFREGSPRSWSVRPCTARARQGTAAMRAPFPDFRGSAYAAAQEGKGEGGGGGKGGGGGGGKEGGGEGGEGVGGVPPRSVTQKRNECC